MKRKARPPGETVRQARPPGKRAPKAGESSDTKENDLKFQAILQTAMDGFWIVDKDGRLVDVNPAYCAMVGYAREELLGRHISDLDTEDDSAEVERRRDKILGRGHDFFEKRHRRKDGGVIELEISVRSIGDVDGHVYAFLHDITQRRFSERMLKLHARILTALNAGGGDRVVIGEILHWIQATLDFQCLAVRLKEGEDYPFFVSLGFDDSFIAREKGLCAPDGKRRALRHRGGAPILECLCGAVLEGRGGAGAALLNPEGVFWTNRLSATVKKRDPASQIPGYRGYCPQEGFESMALIPVKSSGATIGLLQIHDHRPDRFSVKAIEALEKITESIGAAVERSRADEALKLTTRRLGLAVRSGKFGVWDWDLPGNRMVWDERMFEFYGLAPASFTNTIETWERSLHPDDAKRAIAECQAALRGEAPFDTEFRIVKPSGELRVLKADAVVIRDGKGNATRMIGVNRDVTESHRQAEAIREAFKHKEQDLLRARSLQRRLNTHRLPNFPSVDLKGAYVPCQELGGDLLLCYRSGPPGEALFASPVEKLVILLADCTGHGLETSMYATLLVTLAESYLPLCEEGNDTAEYLSRLNHRIAQLGFEDQFPTLFVGVLEGPARMLHYSNANGVLPLHGSAASGAWKELETVEGMHLGFDPQFRFGGATVKLEDGDRLVFFSDAWFERESDLSFPLSRRLGDFKAHIALIESSAGTTPEKIVRLARERFPAADPADDLTLLHLSVHLPGRLAWDMARSSDVASSELVIRGELVKRHWPPPDIEKVLIAFAELAENGLKHVPQGKGAAGVRVDAEFSCERATIRLRDEGPGYDPAAIPDPTDGARVQRLLERDDPGELCGGRGIFLAKRYGTLAWNPKGNEVTLTCDRSRPDLMFREQLFG
jgi:PAS domain S-box-containing protein